ncbi:class II aldolase/adducin family protein [Clostridium sp. LBM24168]
MKPTSEFLMHAAVYKTRRNVYSVVHTHSKFATAFAVIGKPIPSIVYECVNLKDGIVPVAAYGTPGTTELSSSVIRPIKRADALLLESHGVLTVGENPRGAFLKACYVAELAEIYYRALMINGGKEPKVISVEEIQK